MMSNDYPHTDSFPFIFPSYQRSNYDFICLHSTIFSILNVRLIVLLQYAWSWHGAVVVYGLPRDGLGFDSRLERCRK